MGLLREVIEKITNHDARNHEREGVADDDARCIETINLHELESVEEEDEDQIEKLEQQLEDEEVEVGGAW